MYIIHGEYHFTVPPMLSIPNQLEGAYIGQDVTLECHTEAYPNSINYWTTERGDMIVSGNFKNPNAYIFYIHCILVRFDIFRI